MTAHTRLSPRSEVAPEVIAALRPILDNGGGPFWGGWAGLVIERGQDGAIFDLSHTGVEIARCWLALNATAEHKFWPDAASYPTLSGKPPTRPQSTPWLIAGLLPDGMALFLRDNPAAQMMELGDLERCVAWALLP